MILPVFALQIRSGGGGGPSRSIYLWLPKSVFIPFCVPPPYQNDVALLSVMEKRKNLGVVHFVDPYNAVPDGLLSNQALRCFFSYAIMQYRQSKAPVKPN